MLRGRKKITQKEIKKDKLVTAYFESKEWISKEANKKRIYTIVGIAAVATILIFFYVSSKKSKNAEAQTVISPVIGLYEAEKYTEALNGDPAANSPGFLSIIDNYGGTESSETAKFYAANCYYNLKDYDNALKYFEDYSGKNDMLKASSFSGTGMIYELKGDLRKAAELYEKASKVNKDLIINQENLFYALRAYSHAGDKENANRLYKTLRNDYPKSKYISEVKRFESEFKN